MNSFNLRQWSTPLIIGAGLFVAITGVLMFYGVKSPITHAHEWLGLVFALAIGLHVTNHWKPFKSYFSKRQAMAIIGTMAIVATTLVMLPEDEGGNPMRNIIHSVENAPLTRIAPLLDRDPGEIVKRFSESGIVVKSDDQSIAEIASENRLEPRRVMTVLF